MTKNKFFLNSIMIFVILVTILILVGLFWFMQTMLIESLEMKSQDPFYCRYTDIIPCDRDPRCRWCYAKGHCQRNDRHCVDDDPCGQYRDKNYCNFSTYNCGWCNGKCYPILQFNKCTTFGGI